MAALGADADADPWPAERDLCDLPTGFAQQIVATGFTGATAMALLPDGRILVCEQTGDLRMMKNGCLLPEPVLSLTVDSYWERGLIGITLDPRFPENGHVYLCYVAPQAPSRLPLLADRRPHRSG
jgi:glucose/arabinose dehydrogenase